MSYNKLESTDVAQDIKPNPNASTTTTLPDTELEHKSDPTQPPTHNIQIRQIEHHPDKNTSIDENVQYINNMNSNENVVVFEAKTVSNSKYLCSCDSNASMCLCSLWERKDIYTLIVAPIILGLLLLIILAVNDALIMVWFLSVFSFLMILLVGYIYGYMESGSILDLFTLGMMYGGCMGFFAWIFIWLLAMTNFILLGPFIFTHSGYVITSAKNTMLFSILSCVMYGGVFPFLLIWMKSDKRLIEQCFACCEHCKLNGFYTLKEYEQLQHVLNLPQQQMDQFLASNEAEIKAKLEVAMKRLKIECVATVVGYIGSMYILTFLLKFNNMNLMDSTLIFIMGYFVKDFIFGILFGIIAAYIIGRRQLYQIRMNNKFVHYGYIMVLGILQQAVGTILCGLYPQISVRMTIIYISMGVNALICIVAYFEIGHQKKLFEVQLDTLFVYSAVDSALQQGVNEIENPVQLKQVSLSGVDQGAEAQEQ